MGKQRRSRGECRKRRGGPGGGLYISGGMVTLINDTVAGDIAQIGGEGPLGPGGHAGTGKLTGGPGVAGIVGDSEGGGLYVTGGSLSLFNSTVALNLVDTEAVHVTTSGSGGGRGGTTGPSGSLGGGLNVSKGTVVLTSTIVALNTSGTDTTTTVDDIAGAVAPGSSYNLVGTGGSGGLTGTNHNLVGVATPGLGTLADNGGPNQTIALENGSPAIGAGSNPEKLVADERGYTVPAGSPWDIGAFQTSGVSSSTPPTATLEATGVTSANAGSLDPYHFSITYSSKVAIWATSLAGAVVQVMPPTGAAIASTVVSSVPVGPTDISGNASEFVLTYQITPPGGAWTLADDGTYTIELGGAPITDLAGSSVAGGAVGTFSVQMNSNELVVTGQPPGTVTAGTGFSVTVSVENNQGAVQTSWTGSVSIALENSRGATLQGNLTATASGGVAIFSNLALDAAADGYVIQAASTGMPDASSSSFDVTAAAASQLLVTAGPPSSVTAGSTFGLTVTCERPVRKHGHCICRKCRRRPEEQSGRRVPRGHRQHDAQSRGGDILEPGAGHGRRWLHDTGHEHGAHERDHQLD